MTPRSLNLVVTVWWVILFLSVGMLFVFMLLTPEVAVFDSHSKQNEEIQNIRVETNLVFLQQRAVIDVQLAGATNSTAKGLCYLAQGAFLLIFGGSIAGLLQIRRLKKLLKKSGLICLPALAFTFLPPSATGIFLRVGRSCRFGGGVHRGCPPQSIARCE